MQAVWCIFICISHLYVHIYVFIQHVLMIIRLQWVENIRNKSVERTFQKDDEKCFILYHSTQLREF